MEHLIPSQPNQAAQSLLILINTALFIRSDMYMGWVDLDLGCCTALLGLQVATVAAHQPGELPKSESTQPMYLIYLIV